MARFPLRAVDGIGHHGFEFDGRVIWWADGESQPWMTMRALDGTELLRRVENPEFVVPVAPSQRRPRMKEAALAFFAPLLEDA